MLHPTPLPSVRAIKPHMLGMSRVDGVDKVMKLSSNESPLGPGRRALQAMAHAFDDIRLYPESDGHRLRDAIARTFALEPERIVCGAGSDDLISRLVRAFAGAGDEVVFSANGYARYRIHAQAAGAIPVAAPDRDFRADVDALLACVNARTRVLALANPDNPSGLHTPAGEVRRLHAGLPSSCLLVLDCAYAEYARAPDYELPVALAREHANVVMARTFSKIHGLAGLRLGWLYGAPAVVDAAAKVGTSFPVSAPAMAVGIAALADDEHVRASQAHNARWLDWLSAELRAVGLHVYPSEANFVLLRFDQHERHGAEAAYQYMLARGIIPRRFASPAFEHCVRVSIGTEAEMRAAAACLAAFMAA